ncbi:membrane-spanning 4-domains subfamily A member 5 [Erinaceus europaeus]|uniref:Membrane-spanning 4-domains subfamily A member 5 n=1 Tax=Erinaceus europaeus TaxID=9365 RepID=A0A1S2ZI60_ERIEU|nr:membrane-spanning 4-domains subfamily A member 5 [Erinaceus europaeus]
MSSNPAHKPVFLVFPPDIVIPEYQSSELTETSHETKVHYPKLLATKLKVLGSIQILLGVLNFSFGVIFRFTLEDPYPRFPFIFISGYLFWGSILFINSGAFLVALERRTTETMVRLNRLMNFLSVLAAIAGIVLLTFGFITDEKYLCGYSKDSPPCGAVTSLFLGILTLLAAITIIELFVSVTASFLNTPFTCLNCEE